MDNKCITCQHLTWWEGDYCCTAKLRILCPSPDGKFTRDMLMAMKLNRDCEEYKYQDDEELRNLYEKPFNEFLGTVGK